MAVLAAGALFFAACTSVEEVSPGLVVAVVLEPPSTPPMQPDGSRLITTDLGYQVGLVRAYLVSSGVEIFPCPAVVARRKWSSWIVGRAEAHGLTSPTRLGTSLAEPLTGSQEVRRLGSITPPPGRYCRVS